MARRTATANKIDSKKVYQYTVVIRDEEVRIMAEHYTNYEEDKLEFRRENRVVATFKEWDYVFEDSFDEESISSCHEI